MARETLQTTPQEGSQPESGGPLRFLKELPVLVILALGIALLIKAFLVQAFYIPSASMVPTLREGDRVLVNKLSYRFGEPERGDIVVFKNPLPEPCDETGPTRPASCDHGTLRKAYDWFAEVFGLPSADTKDFIKRIVGMPGERMEIRDGHVYVCSTPSCDPVGEDGTPKDGQEVVFESDGDHGPQLDDDDYPDTGSDAFQIPDESYFVMGDNRANSSDARSFGAIGRDLIIGKAFVVVWPATRFGGL
jgi:signal peptidase I